MGHDDDERRTGASVTADDVRAAHARIASYVRRTPLLCADGLVDGVDVTLKLELTQHGGSFKARGAFHNLLVRAPSDAGVTAASGGNHGVAVALAAARLGVRARVFVPEIAARVKIDAIRAHGAEVVVGGARYADAQEACDRFAAETGALRVHPYDAEETIAGAGTVALEWHEDAARLGLPFDAVLVAVGGGGLVAGIAAYLRTAMPAARVVGVEPEGSRCLHAALAAGRPVDVAVDSVAQDSLGARRVGALAFDIARATGLGVVLVPDASIVAAQRKLWRELRIAAEPGAAAALAALLSGAYRPEPRERVGVLVCGGNVDLATLT